MNAKEAYALAASKKDISGYILKIKEAAEAGATEILVPLMNQFQIDELQKLGYFVSGSHSQTTILGSQKCDRHSISWRNAGEVPTNLTAALSGILRASGL